MPLALAELVQLGQQGRRATAPRRRSRPDRRCSKSIVMIGRLVGRILGRDGALIDDTPAASIAGSSSTLPSEEECSRLASTRERRVAALVLGDRDLVLLGEFEQLGAAGQVPFAPRRDHLDVGLRARNSRARSAPGRCPCRSRRGDRVGADLLGDLDLALGDQRPGDRGAEQVLALIERVGAEHREDVVAHEFLAQVVDEDVLGLDARASRPSGAPARAPRPGRDRR